MPAGGLVKVKALLTRGFYYDNLKSMENACSEETDKDKIVSAYILGNIFNDLSTVVEDSPYDKTISGSEAKYKSTIAFLLEKIDSGSSATEQFEILTKLIQMNWNL